MRILHLDSGNEMRGGQWQVLNLVRALGDSTLLTPDNSPLMHAARRHGIDVHPMHMLSIASFSKRADVVHAHDARSHTWAATVTRGPLVVSRRVAFPVRQSLLSRWKYRRPDHFLAVSEYVKQTLVAADVPESKISVVYDGVELAADVSAGERILAVATADPMKGADLLERAAALGGFGVHNSTDLPADLASASVFVYITRSEGLGSAALLAMAAGVPVVGSRVGGLPEVIDHMKTGVLTENTPEAIAEAVALALRHRDEMSRNARRAVEERFTVRHMVERTCEAYRRVLR